ncbi:MAG TPA: CGNR zinc finger domain-containing protein [bacterium]|nr:CGNR zinc finger domain-containing protein [bacterium]
MAETTFERPWHGAEVAGSPALDLTNTLDWRLRQEPVELLSTFGELLRWARSHGILGPAEARTLRAWGAEHPRAAERKLVETRDLREVIAAAAAALSRGEGAPPRVLARLEEAGRRASSARRLRPEGTGAVWDWKSVDADRPALGAALDAIRLLSSPERDKVRQCADAECGRFFLDTSRNASRRWCSMKACGNRNKARRHVRRRREARAETAGADRSRSARG